MSCSTPVNVLCLMLGSMHSLPVPVQFSLCSPSVCRVLLMFFQCLLGSLRVYWVLVMLCLCLLGSIDVLPLSTQFTPCSPHVYCVFFLFSQCLLGSIDVLPVFAGFY